MAESEDENTDQKPKLTAAEKREKAAAREAAEAKARALTVGLRVYYGNRGSMANFRKG